MYKYYIPFSCTAYGHPRHSSQCVSALAWYIFLIKLNRFKTVNSYILSVIYLLYIDKRWQCKDSNISTTHPAPSITTGRKKQVSSPINAQFFYSVISHRSFGIFQTFDCNILTRLNVLVCGGGVAAVVCARRE